MEVTGVKVTKYSKTGNLKGFANVTFDECFVVTGIKILNGQKGLFIAMPSQYSQANDEYYDIYFPITAEFREELQDAVLEAYDEELASGKKKKAKKTASKKKAKKQEENEEWEDD